MLLSRGSWGALGFAVPVAFLLTINASAGVVLPTGNLTCALNTTPFFGSALVTDCAGAATATSITTNPDIFGVSLGMSQPVIWAVAGDAAGGSQIAVPGPTEFQSNILLLTTQGAVGGSGSFTGFMPLHYDFAIDPLSGPTCLVSISCSMDISWSLSLLLQGASVTGGEVALPILHGNGTGTFSGNAVLPTAVNPLIGVGPMTITSGLDMTVSGSLVLNAANFPNDASATFNVIVPQGASFDFQTAATPEPATIGLMAAALLLLGSRRFISRFLA